MAQLLLDLENSPALVEKLCEEFHGESDEAKAERQLKRAKFEAKQKRKQEKAEAAEAGEGEAEGDAGPASEAKDGAHRGQRGFLAISRGDGD